MPDRNEPLREQDAAADPLAQFAAWSEQAREFRNEGFYERFPAKGEQIRQGKM